MSKFQGNVLIAFVCVCAASLSSINHEPLASVCDYLAALMWFVMALIELFRESK